MNSVDCVHYSYDHNEKLNACTFILIATTMYCLRSAYAVHIGKGQNGYSKFAFLRNKDSGK